LRLPDCAYFTRAAVAAAALRVPPEAHRSKTESRAGNPNPYPHPVADGATHQHAHIPDNVSNSGIGFVGRWLAPREIVGASRPTPLAIGACAHHAPMALMIMPRSFASHLTSVPILPRVRWVIAAPITSLIRTTDLARHDHCRRPSRVQRRRSRRHGPMSRQQVIYIAWQRSLVNAAGPPSSVVDRLDSGTTLSPRLR